MKRGVNLLSCEINEDLMKMSLKMSLKMRLFVVGCDAKKIKNFQALGGYSQRMALEVNGFRD